MKKQGLFIEFHDFTQIITPLHKSAGGFVILTRPSDEKLLEHEPYYKPKGQGTFDMIAVEIPFGCTLIIEKGSIHGDSNLKGMHMMAMTCDPDLMHTCDAVFLR